MKLFKKIMILCLMAIAVCKNMEAGLYNKPSLLAQVCSVVPFKTTLGLGLGLMGAAAYSWYRVPQLEIELDKKEYHAKPIMQESKIQEADKDIALLKIVQSKIKIMLELQSKFDDDTKDFFTDLACELDKLRIAPIKRVQSFLVNNAQKHIDDTRTEIAFLKDHKCIADSCKDECFYAKSLLKADEHMCNILKVLQRQCAKDIETLNHVKGLEKYKKEHTDLVEKYEKEKQRVARLNKPISIARTNLNNSIALYKSLQLPCGIAGISLAFIAGISKYFNR